MLILHFLIIWPVWCIDSEMYGTNRGAGTNPSPEQAAGLLLNQSALVHRGSPGSRTGGRPISGPQIWLNCHHFFSGYQGASFLYSPHDSSVFADSFIIKEIYIKWTEGGMTWTFCRLWNPSSLPDGKQIPHGSVRWDKETSKGLYIGLWFASALKNIPWQGYACMGWWVWRAGCSLSLSWRWPQANYFYL